MAFPLLCPILILNCIATMGEDWEDCPIYPTTNRIGVATAVVGVAGVVLALTVILVIYAHRKDQGMLRERIILGLTVSNAIYSAICIVPLQAFEPDCSPAMSPRGGAWIRIAWFATKCEEPPSANTRAARLASCARFPDRPAVPEAVAKAIRQEDHPIPH